MTITKTSDGHYFLLCEDCPWNEAHELLRMVDPTIIGCNYFLVGGDRSKTVITHEIKEEK